MADYTGKGFKGDPEENKSYIYKSLLEDGFTHEAATAVLGNILHETGNFKYLEEIEKNIYGQKGLGILQWSGSRADDFKNWLKVNKKDIADIKANMDYFLLEMRNKKRNHWSSGVNYNKLKTINSVEEATEAFMVGYLRPSKKYAHFNRRLEYAKKYDQVYRGGDESILNIPTVGDLAAADNIAKSRYLYDARKNAEGLIGLLETDQSSVSDRDRELMINSANSLLLNKQFPDVANQTPNDRVVKQLYKTNGSILEDAIVQSDEEFLENHSLLPNEDELISLLPKNSFALGGFLQPNGRVTNFSRDEDKQAQNNTITDI